MKVISNFFKSIIYNRRRALILLTSVIVIFLVAVSIILTNRHVFLDANVVSGQTASKFTHLSGYVMLETGDVGKNMKISINNLSTTTDNTGFYSIDVLSGPAIVNIVGADNESYRIKGNPEQNIVLDADVNRVDFTVTPSQTISPAPNRQILK